MTLPPLGSWGGAFVASLVVVYGLSLVVHLGNLVLVPVLLVVPAALAWSLYVKWLRPHTTPTTPNFDDQVFKILTIGYWSAFTVLLILSLLEFSVLIAMEDTTIDDKMDATAIFTLIVFAVIGACVDEVVKVYFLRTPLYASPVKASRHSHATLALIIATSLGYATFTSVFYLLKSYVSADGYQSMNAGGQALAIVIRLLTLAPLHALCGAVTGRRVVVQSLQRAQQVALLVRASASAAAVDSASFPRAHASVIGHAVSTTATLPSQSQQPQPPSLEPASSSPLNGKTDPPPPAKDAPDAGASELPASVTVWGWPRVLWPAIFINASNHVLALLVLDLDTAPTMGQSAQLLALRAAHLLMCYVVVHHLFLQQWLPLVAGE